MELTAIDGGVRVKETETHYIEVMEQLFNYRVVLTPKANPYTYDAGWCFVGRDYATFLRAVLAAADWDGDPATGPAGWNKNVMTGEWREPS